MLSVLERVLFIATVILALVTALSEAFRKFKLINSGRPVNRVDQPQSRLRETVTRVLLQTPVFSKRPITGFFHALVFWGFLVFVFVTINHVCEGFFAGFLPFGHGLVYKLILFVANLFAGLILLAILYFLIRRYLVRSAGLDIPSWQSLIVLSCISTLMVSFLFYEAVKLFDPGYFELYGKVNFLAAQAFRIAASGPGAVPAERLSFWLHFLWWLHIMVIMGFGVFIFYSKHLHLIAGPINLFLRNRGVKAEIPLVNLEEQETFGTPTIKHLTRKDLLDLFSCAECGRCENVCPAVTSGKELSPKDLLNQLKEHLLSSEKMLTVEGGELKTLLGQVVEDQKVWDCTTCGACMEVCPMMNEHIAKIMGMRQYGVLMESRFPEEFQTLYRGLENQGNPWGIGSAIRSEWAADLSLPLMAEKKEADYLLWVGCAGSYDQHSQKILRALVGVMNRAQLDFAFLGAEEMCCGDPARRTGMEYLFQMLATQNIETLNRYKFNRIVTVCPHGLHVLKNEYVKMGGNYTVIHHSQLLAELVASGKIKPNTNIRGTAAFHDPCYLGRYNQIYQEPRDLIQQAGGMKLTEMANHHQTSFCCGAGGGGMWKEEKVGERISHLRVKQAKKTGVDTLVTACPFCSIMFKDAIGEAGIESLRTVDLVQLLDEGEK